MPRCAVAPWFISAWGQGSLQQYIPSSSKCWMPGDSGRDHLRGDSWPPIIGDKKVTAWITFLGWCLMRPLRNYEEWQPMWLDKSITWKGMVKSMFRCTGQCGTYSAGDSIMSFSLGYGGVLTLAREGAQLPERKLCQQDGDAVSSWRKNSKKNSCMVFLRSIHGQSWWKATCLLTSISSKTARLEDATLMNRDH